MKLINEIIEWVSYLFLLAVAIRLSSAESMFVVYRLVLTFMLIYLVLLRTTRAKTIIKKGVRSHEQISQL